MNYLKPLVYQHCSLHTGTCCTCSLLMFTSLFSGYTGCVKKTKRCTCIICGLHIYYATSLFMGLMVKISSINLILLKPYIRLSCYMHYNFLKTFSKICQTIGYNIYPQYPSVCAFMRGAVFMIHRFYSHTCTCFC